VLPPCEPEGRPPADPLLPDEPLVWEPADPPEDPPGIPVLELCDPGEPLGARLPLDPPDPPPPEEPEEGDPPEEGEPPCEDEEEESCLQPTTLSARDTASAKLDQWRWRGGAVVIMMTVFR
jgi:hypothetical protein